jgi:AmmeMemoRadiSam system protein B
VPAAAVRPPAVAGTFYPADATRLAAEVRAHLAAGVGDGGPPPKALVAPHAGYVYSGPIAGSAFRALAPVASRLRRVVLLGPSHFVPFPGLALPAWRAFSTPLGTVPLDARAAGALADLAQVVVADAPHAREHSLEVELPFLQVALGPFELVPLAVGDAGPEEVAAALDRLWGGEETLVVVSTDLSHYLDYATARRRDEETSRAIVELAPERIGRDDACGRHPLRGLLVAARARGLAGRELDLRSSGDTAGPRHEVVGYGAYAFA